MVPIVSLVDGIVILGTLGKTNRNRRIPIHHKWDRCDKSGYTPVSVIEWVTSGEEQMHPGRSDERIAPVLDVLLGHLTDIPKLIIHLGEWATLDLVVAGNDDRLLCRSTRLARGDVGFAKPASLHETCMDVTDKIGGKL